MRFAICGLLLFAATTCLAEQSGVLAPQQHFVVSESRTISVDELQQRSQSKARRTFADAKLASKQGDHFRSIELFEKVLEKDPGFSDARNDLAVELMVTGKTTRAVTELEQAVQIDPRFLMGYTNLGVILCNQRNFVDAELVLRRALNIQPSSSKANLMLALALDGQGKRGAETQRALELAARSSSYAIKLLKDWYGIAELATVTTESFPD